MPPITLAQITTHPFELPMHGALQWGKRSSFARLTHVAVRVILSDGSEGWAEAPPRPTIYGETVHSISTIIAHELAPRVLNLPLWEPDDDRPLWSQPSLAHLQSKLHEIKQNHTAKGALDMALHSALAQHRGLALRDHLLDGAPHTVTHLRVSYILGIGARDTVLAEARRVVEQGVRLLKVKVGRDWNEDLARIHDLQADLGPGVDLYADANECLDAASAPRVLDQLAQAGLHYCEEPLPVTQLHARAALRRGNHLPIIADDSTFSLPDLQRELAFDTFDILNIKTARTGFTESYAMLHAAHRAGKGIMIGSQASAGLGTYHAALFAALPGINHPSELSFPLKLQADILDRPLPLTDGYLDLAALEAAQLQRAQLLGLPAAV
jgi:L-alanine-DL-glutamate epimerase-like enolase superfamily enzyme